MKMIGMSVRSDAISFCNSRPLRSGRETSSTKQLGVVVRGRARNSPADPNVSGCHPANLTSKSSDSRTEMSSSTTKTIGFCWDLATADIMFVQMKYQLARSAVLSACKRSVGSNGLNRQSTAPWAIKRGRTIASRCAVMKTIGIARSRRVSSCCRSGPVIPGIATSRTRHLVSATDSEARNSSADENACASKPNSFSKSGSDSRTDSSSSTTVIRGCVAIDYDSQAFPIHGTIVTENAPIKARCLSYFGIGIHCDQYQSIDRYLRLIDSLPYS